MTIDEVAETGRSRRPASECLAPAGTAGGPAGRVGALGAVAEVVLQVNLALVRGVGAVAGGVALAFSKSPDPVLGLAVLSNAARGDGDDGVITASFFGPAALACS